MNRIRFAGIVFWAFMLGLSPAWGMRELTDNQLDVVTAGASLSTQRLEDGAVRFQFQKDLGSGNRSVDGEGSILVRENPLSDPTGRLILSDNAQGNLRAISNVVAVNSDVEVLINLTINVNSRVGAVRQINLRGNL